MICLAVLLGSLFSGLVQTVTGFGAGTMLMMLLPLFFSLTAAPTIALAVCLALNVTLSFRFWRQIQWRVTLLPSLLYLVASLIGIWLVAVLDLHLFALAFYGFLILLAIYLLFIAGSASIRATPLSCLVCSAVGGACGGMFGCGGPLMALYFTAASGSKEAYIGNTQFCFLIGGFFSIAFRARAGLFELSFLPVIVVGCIGVLLGQRLAGPLREKLDRERLNRLICICVGASGLIGLFAELI